jgi:hypothetical protein
VSVTEAAADDVILVASDGLWNVLGCRQAPGDTSQVLRGLIHYLSGLLRPHTLVGAWRYLSGLKGPHTLPLRPLKASYTSRRLAIPLRS